MEPTLAGIALGFVLLAALLWALERVWPSVRGQRVRRRAGRARTSPTGSSRRS